MAEPLFHGRAEDAATCPDCGPVSRRQFVKAVGAGLLAASTPIAGRPALAAGPGKAGPSPSDLAETAVARFFKSLNDQQRKLICFPFDHPRRSMVRNNWAIVKPMISDLKPDQRELCREIMKNLCSEDGYERFMRQMDDDSPKGFDDYHVAVFGEPGTDKPFEWVLSGRHDTLRADGNSVEGAAFGGPIFYGHAADGNDNEDPRHTNNVWWYQGEQANKVFKALDEKQRVQALLEKSPGDPDTFTLRGEKAPKAGLDVGTLDGQQKAMVRDLVEMMLRPFRAADVAEVRECLDVNGGVDRLRLTYFKEDDLGDDGVWDRWMLEGPAFAWYFRGSPHVHTWLNVARKA